MWAGWLLPIASAHFLHSPRLGVSKEDLHVNPLNQTTNPHPMHTHLLSRQGGVCASGPSTSASPGTRPGCAAPSSGHWRCDARASCKEARCTVGLAAALGCSPAVYGLCPW